MTTECIPVSGQKSLISKDNLSNIWLEQAAHTARAVFGYDGLRPHQTQVLEQVLAGRDCLAVLPTGAGKSLCYGLPAHMRPGLVLVISPLIALIRDQQHKFAASGIASAALDSLQSMEERAAVWERLERRELQLLIVSPERLARADFRDRLKSENLQLVAVDEAHCISQWGGNFRPDYRLIGSYLRDFGPVPKLAVTATATQKVREDIIQALDLRSPEVVWGGFARENLRLKVVRADKVAALFAATLQAVLGADGSGIVYTPTRKQTREVWRMLTSAGIASAMYHGGLSASLRDEAQQAFMTDKVRVVVATHAFGLGIDKSNIRFVHHAGMPGSLEQYVQEIGRAGRDGQPATCSLVFGSRDYHVHKFMIDKSFPDLAILRSLLGLARSYLADSMGESPESLVRHLCRESGLDQADVATGLDVLCREGILSRLRTRMGGLGGYDEELIAADGSGDEVGFFRDYPLRKLESLAKLEAMRSYANLETGRADFLDSYFRG
ncbi:MAG: ATP-dependent DNA helicase RecQ [Deltaproteobacteria bacterium]|nr:ATP-dependent DNA helicase RecQ [Deltaproteobacteria bacterium]